jgi:hypothetical protein
MALTFRILVPTIYLWTRFLVDGLLRVFSTDAMTAGSFSATTVDSGSLDDEQDENVLAASNSGGVAVFDMFILQQCQLRNQHFLQYNINKIIVQYRKQAKRSAAACCHWFFLSVLVQTVHPALFKNAVFFFSSDFSRVIM